MLLRICALTCASPLQGRALCTRFTNALCIDFFESQTCAPATRRPAGVPGGGRQRRNRQNICRNVVHAALGARRGQGGALAHHLRDMSETRVSNLEP